MIRSPSSEVINVVRKVRPGQRTGCTPPVHTAADYAEAEAYFAALRPTGKRPKKRTPREKKQRTTPREEDIIVISSDEDEPPSSATVPSSTIATPAARSNTSTGTSEDPLLDVILHFCKAAGIPVKVLSTQTPSARAASVALATSSDTGPTSTQGPSNTIASAPALAASSVLGAPSTQGPAPDVGPLSAPVVSSVPTTASTSGPSSAVGVPFFSSTSAAIGASSTLVASSALDTSSAPGSSPVVDTSLTLRSSPAQGRFNRLDSPPAPGTPWDIPCVTCVIRMSHEGDPSCFMKPCRAQDSGSTLGQPSGQHLEGPRAGSCMQCVESGNQCVDPPFEAREACEAVQFFLREGIGHCDEYMWTWYRAARAIRTESQDLYDWAVSTGRNQLRVTAPVIRASPSLSQTSDRQLQEFRAKVAAFRRKKARDTAPGQQPVPQYISVRAQTPVVKGQSWRASGDPRGISRSNAGQTRQEARTPAPVVPKQVTTTSGGESRKISQPHAIQSQKVSQAQAHVKDQLQKVSQAQAHVVKDQSLATKSQNLEDPQSNTAQQAAAVAEEDEEWEVEKIVAHRKNKKAKCQEYLVKWTDWGDEHNEYVLRQDLVRNAGDMLREYERSKSVQASAPTLSERSQPNIGQPSQETQASFRSTRDRSSVTPYPSRGISVSPSTQPFGETLAHLASAWDWASVSSSPSSRGSQPPADQANKDPWADTIVVQGDSSLTGSRYREVSPEVEAEAAPIRSATATRVQFHQLFDSPPGKMFDAYHDPLAKDIRAIATVLTGEGPCISAKDLRTPQARAKRLFSGLQERALALRSQAATMHRMSRKITQVRADGAFKELRPQAKAIRDCVTVVHSEVRKPDQAVMNDVASKISALVSALDAKMPSVAPQPEMFGEGPTPSRKRRADGTLV